MQIIKTKQDIDVLRRAEALSAVLLDLVNHNICLLNCHWLRKSAR